ncbi:50S ribosomal protein L31 [Candidatus Dependentiae bacterium]
MKKGIHPERFESTVVCACGNKFSTVSTKSKIEIDICSACHPFFTGQQKFVDRAGRIEKFQARYANVGDGAKKNKKNKKK